MFYSWNLIKKKNVKKNYFFHILFDYKNSKKMLNIIKISKKFI